MRRFGSNGPDWTDVAMLMAAIGQLHTCRVSLIATVPTAGHKGGMHLVAEANFQTLPASDLPRQVVVAGDWPTKKHATFEGLAYNLVWQLDFAIGQAYEQMSLVTQG